MVPIQFSNSLCRHHPRKRVIQYSRAPVFIISALEYWVAGSSRAMTTEYGSAFSRQAFARVLQFVCASSQEEGAGKVRVRAAPAVSCALMHNKKCAHEHTGSADTLRPSLRNGFTTYTCSPWRPGFLVTIISVMREHHRKLDANPGASGPHAFAVRIDAARLRHDTSTATRPDVSDDGRRPLYWDGMGSIRN